MTTTRTLTTTRDRCRAAGPHGTYWAYAKGCRCLAAVLDDSEYRRRRRSGDPIELVTDATGACDIARGLAAYGYTTEQIATAAGISVRLVFQLQAGKDTIRTSKDQALRAAAERLVAAPAPTGYAASVARGVAARKGWTTSLAWTGLDGRSTTTDPDAFDPITVGLAIDGRLTHAQIAGHKPDLIETVRRLAVQKTDQQIADHLRWPSTNGDAVYRFRQRNNIPNQPAPREVIAPHRARDRARAARRTRQEAAA